MCLALDHRQLRRFRRVRTLPVPRFEPRNFRPTEGSCCEKSLSFEPVTIQPRSSLICSHTFHTRFGHLLQSSKCLLFLRVDVTRDRSRKCPKWENTELYKSRSIIRKSFFMSVIKNFRSVVEIFTSEDDVVVEKVRRKCFRNVGGVEVDSVAETILQGFRFRSRLAQFVFLLRIKYE